MELPSQDLRNQLAALNVSIPGDLKRAARTVRRLARGLPVTETVWIDALVSIGSLTPFQGRCLESGQGAELIHGGKYVLQTPRVLDPVLPVVETRERGRKSALLLSRVGTDPRESEEALNRLTQTLRNLAIVRDRIPGLPHDAFLEGNQLCLISPAHAGESLSKLLVRRGRFPEEVVRQLALEVIRQLQTAEPYALHGDLRLTNFWLGDHGEVALLNWGLLAACSPSITIHTRLPDDAGDSMAPERIDSPRRASVPSEIYSLGCVLWQLLAGRPPFLLMDPLAKLTAHRTRSVPDVRTIAPETSESLASLIRNMTARDVTRRMQTFADVRQQLAGPSSRRRNLRQFSRAFKTVTPSQRLRPDVRRKSRVPAMAACLFFTMVLAGAAWQRDRLGIPRLGRAEATTVVAATVPTFQSRQTVELGGDADIKITSDNSPAPIADSAAAADHANSESERPLRPLPAVEGDRLLLEADAEYLAGDVISTESLLVTTDPSRPATIHVKSAPLRLHASKLRMEHVRIVVHETEASPLSRPVQIQSQTIVIDHSLAMSQGASEEAVLFSWNVVDPLAAAQLLVRDSEFLGQGDLIQVSGPLSSALLQNVQTEGLRVHLKLDQGARSGLRVPVMFNACTFRGCGPLVSLPTGRLLQQSGLISIQGADSLVDLALGEGLIELDGSGITAAWDKHVEIAAQGLVTAREIILALSRNRETQVLDELDSQNLIVDGLLSGSYRFVPGNNGRDRLQIDSLPVRYSPEDPGADPKRLPVRPLR